ncbi:MAG: hypothetical protein ABJC26_01890 [Gemmatimonadaceae bacterium]
MPQTTAPTPPTNDDRPKQDGRSRGRLRSGRREGLGDQTNPKTIFTAIALHVVVIAVLVRMVTLGHGLHDWFGLRSVSELPQERIEFIDTAKPKPPEPKKVVVEKPVVKQTNTTTSPRPSTGPVVGVEQKIDPAIPTVATGGDSTAARKPRDLGIDPSLVGVARTNADPRIWSPTGVGLNVPRTGQQLLDSVVAYAITSAADSIDSIARITNPSRQPGDWTKRLKNGDKWGWDKTGLRLGKYTVPNALLALLPAGIQKGMSGNPTAYQNDRRLAFAREDIQRFGAQAIGEAQFKKAVKEQRAKADRDHQRKADELAREKNDPQSKLPSKAQGGGGGGN